MTDLSYETQLYQKYAIDKSKASKERLILSLNKFINNIVYRYGSKNKDIRQEQAQEAYVAVLECIDNYDIAKGADVKTWLYWTVRNAVLGHIYNSCYPVKLPSRGDYKFAIKEIRNHTPIEDVCQKYRITPNSAYAFNYWLHLTFTDLEDLEIEDGREDYAIDIDKRLAHLTVKQAKALLHYHLDKDDLQTRSMKEKKRIYYLADKAKKILAKLPWN